MPWQRWRATGHPVQTEFLAMKGLSAWLHTRGYGSIRSRKQALPYTGLPTACLTARNPGILTTLRMLG